jgi:hypothetical protein
MGTSRPEKVGKAVIRAIQNDIPQLIINPYPVRPMFALSEVSPRLGAWIARAMGASKFFKKVYESRSRKVHGGVHKKVDQLLRWRDCKCVC